jgi:tetratricopeptide (TPR) repeat protein
VATSATLSVIGNRPNPTRKSIYSTQKQKPDHMPSPLSFSKETGLMSELPDFDRMWNYNELEKTEKAFRDLIPIAQSSANRDYYTQLLTQIARTQSLQRKFETAHQILDEVKALLNDETPAARIRYCLERGRAFNSSNNVEAARPLFQQAWDLACKECEDYHAIDAAHMIGICERDNSNLSLSWSEKAMEVAEKSDHPRAKGWLGALYNNTGWTYHDLGQYERALDLFEKGLFWRQERNDDRATRVAKWTVARALRSLERVEEALIN